MMEGAQMQLNPHEEFLEEENPVQNGDAYDSKNQAQDFQGVHRERSWVDIPENHLVLQAGEENAAATDPSENSPKRDYPVLNRAPVLSPIPGASALFFISNLVYNRFR
mmetsp:Transcript_23250/g.52197  ORF Transcript_23250/g.52197 Transcript_23250/m.52197 type:complete len:108 (-) Transcript_23250:426-749(-)